MKTTVGFCLLAFLVSVAPTFAKDDPLKRPAVSVFPEDARLSTCITVKHGRVYLGELMEELTAKTKLRLSVSDSRGPVDGIDITLFVKDRPLREVMGGLQTILSSRFDSWEWRRNGKSGYVLHHSRTPEEAAGIARRDLMARWSSDLKEYSAIANLPEPERSLRAKSRPDLFPGGDIDVGRVSLVKALRAEHLDALLRGAFVPLDTNGLPEAARNGLELGVTGAPETPRSKPGFYISWDRNRMAPILWVQNSKGIAGNTLGSNSWEDSWLDATEPNWRKLSDWETQSFLMRQGGGGPSDPAVGGVLQARTLQEWLKRASERQPLNIIAHSMESGSMPSGWLGRTPEQTVLAFVIAGRMVARKEGEIFLARHRTATVDPKKQLVPWKTIRSFREHALKNGGFLELPQLLDLSEMTPEQTDGLSEEFPDANSGKLPRWRPILRFAASLTPESREKLLSRDGLRIADSGLIARAALTEGPDPDNERGLPLLDQQFRFASVRLSVQTLTLDESQIGSRAERRFPRPSGGPLDDSKKEAPKAQELAWEILVDGKVIHRRTYRNQERKPLQPE